MESQQPILGDFIALVNHNPDMISRIDGNLTVTYVNDSVCKASGHSRDFYIGKKVYEIFEKGKAADFFCDKIRRVFETGNPESYQMEGFWRESQYFQYDIIPLKDENNKVNHVVSILKDITAARKHEEQLKNTIRELEVLSDQLIYQNKLLQDFAYITSHNLRSPLSNFRALLQLYEVYENNSEEKRAVYEKIKNTLDSLTKTVSELSDTINIKGNLKKELETISFQKQLDEVKESLSSQIEEAGAVIQTSFSRAPEILYPKIYLESIFLNLLTNSLKYRSFSRQLIINIETKKTDGYTILVWKDNGIGIDMKKHGSKLFGLKYTFHEREDSRGIGLYITRNQIESVGGTITAESKLNEGATFTIRFKDLTSV